MMTEWLSLKLVRSRMVSGWTTKLEQLRTGGQPWEKGKCDHLVVVFFNPLCHSFINFFWGGVQLPIRVETIFQGLLYNPIAKFHLHACWESLYGPTKRSIIYNPIFSPEPILCPSISRSIVWDLFFLRSVCFFRLRKSATIWFITIAIPLWHAIHWSGGLQFSETCFLLTGRCLLSFSVKTRKTPILCIIVTHVTEDSRTRRSTTSMLLNMLR